MPDIDLLSLDAGGMKTALVTGASSGIGKETAKALLAAGYRVYAGARRVGPMRPLADAGARVLALDVADEASATSAVEAILREAGRIDVLVNCAGYGLYGSVEEAPLQEARRQMEVNLFGPARLIRKVLPTMRAQRSGRIVNISSSGGRFGGPFGGWYHASKFAMEGFSDSLRMELRAFGIDVVLIEPGAIRTEGNGISRANLTMYSGRGPYRREAGNTARMMAAADEGPLASPPNVVAQTIVGAVTARRPRTRYATGGGAKTILFLRRVLPDRAFDAVMRMAVRPSQKRSVRRKGCPRTLPSRLRRRVRNGEHKGRFS